MSSQLGSFEKILRVGEGRRMKRLAEQAAYITSIEPEFSELSDDELRGKTAEFRERLENGETLEELLFEAFAAVREARVRESGQRMFDVQLMGGIVLHEGDVAEMKTGEGKTFVASLALYLNGLEGKGVHLVTVNDYLAKRDAEWNRGVFERLGMTVGAIENMMPFAERKVAYDADITYGTNSEFGFDYLRDNMAVSLDGLVQRSHSYAIVDEVDSILIDEARTPLIISGEPEAAAQIYYDFARIARGLNGVPHDPLLKGGDPDADYEYDEKHKTIAPGRASIEAVERALRIENLYDPRNSQLVNHLNQALKAESLYKRDVDYVIQDGEVKIVDEFTGRIMEGRRWSEGLHQAIEAKEGVKIQEENVTLATITLQNYFRLYEKLAGMTGTAKTEEKEFVEIYNLHVVEIPTNVNVARDDKNDLIFKSAEGKFQAVMRDIKERHEQGQPVLVGTIAVETSEYLSELLKRQGIPHSVLNAKEHAREAEIIVNAGQKGAVTIATNMAGRGVDIKLGEGVVEAGGLYVLGTERHEARRIDNQLRGRAGRQGDPGESRFYLSGEDDLVRLFAGDRIKRIMERFKIPDDQPMEAKILSNQIEGAQKKVEEQNFVARKNVLKYDNVQQRREVLEGSDMSEQVRQWIDEVVERTVNEFTAEEYAEEWDLEALVKQMATLYDTEVTADELREDLGELSRESLVEDFQEDARDSYAAKEEELTPDLMRELERFVILQVVDQRWREHLDGMDYMREGVHLRAMAQKDPLVEYQHEGHIMFSELGASIHEEVVLTLFHAQLAPEEADELQRAQQAQAQALNGGGLQYEHESLAGAEAMLAAGGASTGSTATMSMAGGSATTSTAGAPRPIVNTERDNIGRNDPCWCGSGKKFKKCHGA
jgi:preprotein translocase subunit SecA